MSKKLDDLMESGVIHSYLVVGGDYLILLPTGRKVANDHSFSAETVRSALEIIKRAKPCTCPECKSLGAAERFGDRYTQKRGGPRVLWRPVVW